MDTPVFVHFHKRKRVELQTWLPTAKSYRLRFEADGLFIVGAEELNYDLLEEGIHAWTQSLDGGADLLASNQGPHMAAVQSATVKRWIWW